MNQSSILQQTIDYVKETLSSAEGGHDWFHIERVWKNARQIAQTEDVDMEIVELGALLHDIADSKFHGGDEEIGPRMAQRFLEEKDYPADRTAHVVNIVRHISFKGGKETEVFTSPELQVVQDADRVDAIGAIGIARAFHYGGFKGRALYDPAIPPNLHMTKEEYKSSPAPTINHFYEKLLLLADLMNTETGRQLAMERHQFMESFLDQFYKEWEVR